MVFGKLFGGSKRREPGDPNRPSLRPMEMGDVPRVLDIIAQTDEDDAEAAERMFASARSIKNMFVLWYQNQIVGVTGYGASEGDDNVVWLSWTYIDEDAQGDGLGGFMVEELLGLLNRRRVRKLFISTSDYAEDGVPIYAAAHAFYEQLGAKIELTLPDFYGEGEARIIYGLDNPGMAKPESFEGLGERGCVFFDVGEDDEAEDVGVASWEETEDGSVDGVDRLLGIAHSREYRALVVALPADISDMATGQLEETGFERIGILSDFYALELGQVWWMRHLA